MRCHNRIQLWEIEGQRDTGQGIQNRENQLNRERGDRE
tara:strand:+ start:627 stop:740 length:114 start_codon:yes stop_codon:yes gene_type:complete